MFDFSLRRLIIYPINGNAKKINHNILSTIDITIAFDITREHHMHVPRLYYINYHILSIYTYIAPLCTTPDLYFVNRPLCTGKALERARRVIVFCFPLPL